MRHPFSQKAKTQFQVDLATRSFMHDEYDRSCDLTTMVGCRSLHLGLLIHAYLCFLRHHRQQRPRYSDPLAIRKGCLSAPVIHSPQLHAFAGAKFHAIQSCVQNCRVSYPEICLKVQSSSVSCTSTCGRDQNCSRTMRFDSGRSAT